ncbi:MAG TPA: ABC transporter ATP-binding protein [Methylomirabilota bacterium]|nr:ABC transporter ATP-binding protein [Methylomirabilota bacterium]
MKNIFRIITISKPLHPLAITIAVLIVISASLQLVASLLSKSIVDQIVLRIQHKGGDIHTLIFLVILAFVISLLSLIATVFSDRLGDHFGGKLQKFLTEKFYNKVLTLPQEYFDSEVSGKIINQLNRGIVSIKGFLNSSTNFILPTFLQSIFTVVVLAYYNLPIAIFTFCLFPIYLILSYYSTVRWGKEEVKKNKIEDHMRGRMQEVITNMMLVKGFTNERPEYELVSKSLGESNEIYAKQSQTYHIFDFFRGFSLNIILFAVNILVFYNTFQGHLTIGEMVLILQLFNQARIPLFAMSFILTQIQTAESGSKEYFEVIGLESTENYRKNVPVEKIKNPKLTFENVSFNYATSKDVLKDVSFDLKNGESVALVGHSGAGKSTIVSLLLKFYQPTSGNLMLNNISYQKLDYHHIRQNIALVFQENELFSSTIKENVAYGKPNATGKEIIQALKLANAWDFVTKLPHGIESEVGERGVRLSGGQKQRIQIARAILKDAPILILDEATSSLDAKSEKEVQVALEKLMQGKLTLIIAHRFSTIQNVDKIVVIDNGIIVDMGNPKELSHKEGIYKDLLHYQIEGNKKLLESFELH